MEFLPDAFQIFIFFRGNGQGMGDRGKYIGGMDDIAFQDKEIIDKSIDTSGKITGKEFPFFKYKGKDLFVNASDAFGVFAAADKDGISGKIQKVLKMYKIFFEC